MDKTYECSKLIKLILNSFTGKYLNELKFFFYEIKFTMTKVLMRATTK